MRRSSSGPRSVPGTARSRVAVPDLGVRVDDRELDLVGVRPEVHEQLVDVVEDLRRPGIAAVDLVDRDDDRQVAGHRLLEHVAGLRQRPLGRVDEQQDRVDHQERALHLAAEVGVAGRVDDVEPDPGVVDGRLLGQDRDALLALEVARVHDPVDDGLVGAERAGLAEHRVHERGLAVVHVRHDGDVAEVGADRGGVLGEVRGRGVGHGRILLQIEWDGRLSHGMPDRGQRTARGILRPMARCRQAVSGSHAGAAMPPRGHALAS